MTFVTFIQGMITIRPAAFTWPKVVIALSDGQKNIFSIRKFTLNLVSFFGISNQYSIRIVWLRNKLIIQWGSMLKIIQIPLGALQTNSYLLACTQTKQAAVIDPAWDGQLIFDQAAENGWTISHILLTHSHFDHVGGLAEIKQLTNAPIYIHPEAIPMLKAAPMAASMWQMQIPVPPAADKMLAAGDVILVGELKLEVLFTPGHAPGHVCFYLPAHNVIFDGDVLFQQSIGRTDLPGGDHALLMKSIKENLLDLPDETAVLSGHGPTTTIGQEKQWNPFL